MYIPCKRHLWRRPFSLQVDIYPAPPPRGHFLRIVKLVWIHFPNPRLVSLLSLKNQSVLLFTQWDEKRKSCLFNARILINFIILCLTNIYFCEWRFCLVKMSVCVWQDRKKLRLKETCKLFREFTGWYSIIR